MAPRNEGGGVGDVELGPVAHHEHDPRTGTDAQCRQAGGGPGDVIGELVVGPLPGLVERIGEGDDVAVSGNGREESSAARCPMQTWPQCRMSAGTRGRSGLSRTVGVRQT